MNDLLRIRLLRDRARAVPGEDAHGPAGDAAARLRAALDGRGAPDHTALSNVNRDGTTTPILINGSQAYGVTSPHYLGPIIIAQKNRPVRIKFVNALPTGAEGYLFLPVDGTIMGSGST